MHGLAQLDNQIEQREQELITDTELAARNEVVSKEFAAIATEHSSKWSKQEIHDRLRQEIDRLAQHGMAGAPGPLVVIPIIPAGRLVEGGKDFREYQLTFKLAPASIEAVVEYLKRLHESPQALRIDGLELTRAPDSALVVAQIDVTRTVVNGVTDVAPNKPAPAAPAANLVRNGSFELPSKGAGPADDWDVVGCSAAISAEFATEGKNSLSVTAGDALGTVSQKQDVECGATYEVKVAILNKSGAEAQLGIADETGKSKFEGALPVAADGVARAYVYRFTAPGAPGSKASLRAPYLELAPGSKTTLFMDDASVTKIGGQ